MVSILSFDEGFNGLVKVVEVELSLGEFKPDFGFVSLISELSSDLDVLNVVKQDLDGFNVLTELLVDAKSFFVKFVLGFLSNVSELNSIVVIKSVDVVHHTPSLRADSSQNQEVLEISVSSEVRVVEDDTLEEVNELARELGFDEGADGSGDLIDILNLGESSLDDLVDDLLAVLVLSVQDLSPEFGVGSLDQVAGLSSEEVVLVSNFNELVVAGSPSTFVGDEGQVGVSLFAVLTDDLGVVVLILDEEVLGFLVAGIYVDLGKGVV
jgi:hypothetical protein